LTSTKASVVSTTANSCDSSLFVADVTIPDNTSMAAGTTFTKTWTLNNNGSCTWNSSYSLKFVSGSQMSGSTTSIGSSIGPTHDLNVSISMTAPSTAGTYTGYWRLVNASGEFFGQPVTVTIVVVAATATLTPTATLTSTVTPVYVIITATPVPTTAPTATTVPTVATTAPVTAVTATTGS
jgi:hypothetical protein